jgi:hypothetical protein
MAKAPDVSQIDRSALESALSKLGESFGQRAGKIQPGWQRGSQRNQLTLSLEGKGLSASEQEALTASLGKYSAKLEGDAITIIKPGKYKFSDRGSANFINSMNREMDGTVKNAGNIPAPAPEVVAPEVSAIEAVIEQPHVHEPLVGSSEVLGSGAGAIESGAVIGSAPSVLSGSSQVMGSNPTSFGSVSSVMPNGSAASGSSSTSATDIEAAPATNLAPTIDTPHVEAPLVDTPVIEAPQVEAAKIVAPEITPAVVNEREQPEHHTETPRREEPKSEPIVERKPPAEQPPRKDPPPARKDPPSEHTPGGNPPRKDPPHNEPPRKDPPAPPPHVEPAVTPATHAEPPPLPREPVVPPVVPVTDAVKAGEQALERQGVQTLEHQAAQTVVKAESKLLPAIGKMISHHPVLSTAAVIGGLAAGYGAYKMFAGGGDKQETSHASRLRQERAPIVQKPRGQAFAAAPDVYAGAMHVNDRSMQQGLSEGISR